MLNKLQTTLSRLYQQYIPNVAVLFLFPVSCWSTYSGIRELMRSTAGVGEIEGLLISIALTVGIQVTLLLAVCSLMRAPYRQRPLYLAIYVMTVFFSVLFGYAFYFRHLRADDLAREVHQQESQRLLLDARDYQASLGALSSSFRELARYSETQSRLEDQQGGTCGDDSPQGRGPRALGRRKDAQLFATFDGRLGETAAGLEAALESLQADVAAFDIEHLRSHHDALEFFYQDLSAGRSQTVALLADVRTYVNQRFPDGRYTIRERGQVYGCPDSQLEYLAGLVAGAAPPELPPPPAIFEADNPKVVVHYALEQLAGWLSGAGGTGRDSASAVLVSEGSFSQSWQRNLPLFLGLLVDCLIFLAAFSTQSTGGAEVSALERLGRLEKLPTSVREGLRRQLASLLGCAPSSSLFAAYRILQRYEIRRGVSLRPWVRVTPAASFVAVPRAGVELEGYPELVGLQDLVRLLESLGLAVCQSTDIAWSDLPQPLPAGLSEIAGGRQLEVRQQQVELYRLDSRLMGDLVKEAFVSDRLADVVEETSIDDAAAVGGAGEAPASI